MRLYLGLFLPLPRLAVFWGFVMKRLALMIALALAGCVEAPSSQAKVLVMGDSLLAVNGMSGGAVADALERETGVEVTDRSVPGARFFHPLPISGAAGMSIPKQYARGAWEWVVLNGGGNDVLWGCGCGPCGGTLERLISVDGRGGEIPRTVSQLRSTGAKVIFVGYLRSNGFDSPVEKCATTGDEMDRRLTLMAANDPGVMFLSMADLVPMGDQSYYGPDLIHPSPKGSAGIAARIAAVMRQPVPPMQPVQMSRPVPQAQPVQRWRSVYASDWAQ